MRGIITADFHLRADRPRCRLDEDWMKSQRKAIESVVEIAIDKECDIYVIGDIFNTPRVSPEVVSMFISSLEGMENNNLNIRILAGNHDLPYHSWDNVNQSSFGILWNMVENFITPLTSISDFYWALHFGETKCRPPENGDPVLFLHRLVFPSKKSIPPNTSAITASDLLKEYPDYKWIFVGDYHSSYHYEENGRHVVNPGCLIRQRADLMDYQPEVAYVDTDEGTVEWIEIEDKAVLVTDEYLRKEEERSDRIEAFVESVKKSGQISLSFIDNLNERIAENRDEIGEEAINIIEEIREETK